jgi:5-methylcytosine-specific restriction endonuclease McrA
MLARLEKWIRKLEKKNRRQWSELADMLAQSFKIEPPSRGSLRIRIKQTLSTREDPFCKTKEWQVLRYKAIKRYGRKCMACGIQATEIHVDHIKPRSKFPKLSYELSNLQILCRDCNLGKGAWDETDWRKKR